MDPIYLMPSPSSQGSAEIVSPLDAEGVSVGHPNIERCGVHVCTIGHAHPTGEVLTHERVEIERVAIGRTVEAVPPVRDNGRVQSAMAVVWA